MVIWLHVFRLPLKTLVYTCLYFFDQWLESEILRIKNLRDRANEKGHLKEYPLLLDMILMFLVFFTLTFSTMLLLYICHKHTTTNKPKPFPTTRGHVEPSMLFCSCQDHSLSKMSECKVLLIGFPHVFFVLSLQVFILTRCKSNLVIYYLGYIAFSLCQ